MHVHASLESSAPFLLPACRTTKFYLPPCLRCWRQSAVQGTFIPAQRFEGKKLGYMFSKGAHGLGYYMDASQAVRLAPCVEWGVRSLVLLFTGVF